VTSLLYVNIGEPETSGATTTVVELLRRLPKFNVKVGLEELLFSGEKGIADKFPYAVRNVRYHRKVMPYRESFTGRYLRFIYKNTFFRGYIDNISKNYDFTLGFYTHNSIIMHYLEPYISFPLYKHYFKLVKQTNPIDGTAWFTKTLIGLRRYRRSERSICAGKVLQNKVKELGISCKVLDPPAGVDLELVESSPILEGYDLLHVARQGLMKGTPEAIEVARRLGLSSAFIGKVDHGFSMPQGVNYLGMIPDQRKIYGIMKGSRVFIYPSHVDSFGIVVAEALSCGLPVVAYDIPALRYYYGDCGAVKLVKEGDIEGMVNAVKEFLKGEYHDVAKACAKKYSWDKVAESFKEILEGFSSKELSQVA
jgi:glycosyltransferase involved in cell wall biosynthesis